MLRQIKKAGCHNRLSRVIGLACLGISLAASQAPALETARELMTRGEALLLQAQSEPDGKSRDQHLGNVVKTFSKAYSLGLRRAQIHALIGAAQGYLLMREAPSQFPFLWSAPPLQRALKSLQQVLVLQPDNTAANLLMGMALWRRAEPPRSADERHSQLQPYLRQVASAGVHVRLPTSDAAPAGFTVGDAILALRYVDARGTGRIDDLLFVYVRGAEPGCYGVVVSAGRSYPLVSDATTGKMAMTTTLTAIDVQTETSLHPILVVTWSAPKGKNQVMFQWNGESFQAMTTAR